MASASVKKAGEYNPTQRLRLLLLALLLRLLSARGRFATAASLAGLCALATFALPTYRFVVVIVVAVIIFIIFTAFLVLFVAVHRILGAWFGNYAHSHLPTRASHSRRLASESPTPDVPAFERSSGTRERGGSARAWVHLSVRAAERVALIQRLRLYTI